MIGSNVLSGQSVSRIAERDARVYAHCAKVPPWWRVFAWRAWRRELRALLVIDVSQMAEYLLQHHSGDALNQRAYRSSPNLGLIKRTKKATPRKKRRA